MLIYIEYIVPYICATDRNYFYVSWRTQYKTHKNITLFIYLFFKLCIAETKLHRKYKREKNE